MNIRKLFVRLKANPDVYGRSFASLATLVLVLTLILVERIWFNGSNYLIMFSGALLAVCLSHFFELIVRLFPIPGLRDEIPLEIYETVRIEAIDTLGYFRTNCKVHITLTPITHQGAKPSREDGGIGNTDTSQGVQTRAGEKCGQKSCQNQYYELKFCFTSYLIRKKEKGQASMRRPKVKPPAKLEFIKPPVYTHDGQRIDEDEFIQLERALTDERLEISYKIRDCILDGGLEDEHRWTSSIYLGFRLNAELPSEYRFKAFVLKGDGRIQIPLDDNRKAIYDSSLTSQQGIRWSITKDT